MQPQAGLSAASSDFIDDIRSRSMHSVAELTTLISQSPSDYSYFDLGKLKLHDLPKHLKMMATRLANERRENEPDSELFGTNAAQARMATVRNRKEIPKIDFGIVIERTKFFKVTKKAIFLGDKTLEKRSEKPLRIETERQFEFNGKELFQPYYKPITVRFKPIFEIFNGLLFIFSNKIAWDLFHIQTSKKYNKTACLIF